MSSLFCHTQSLLPPPHPEHTLGEMQVEILDIYECVKQGGYTKEAR